MTLIAFFTIYFTVFLLLYSIGSIIDFFNQKPLHTPLDNPSQAVVLSNIENYQNIQWTDILTYEQADNVVFDEELLAGSDQNLNIDEQLTNLISQKDRVTQEIFHAGEKVYFCVSCQLGYHEDSWQFLDMKCDQCKSSNVSMYSLPLTVVREEKKPTTDELLTQIDFRDINSDETFDNFPIDPDYYFNQGLEQLKIKNYIKAIEYFTKALQLNPANPNNDAIYYSRGIAYYKIKKYNGAIENYNWAIIKNNNHASAYCSRGNIRYKLGNIHVAIEDYSQALYINPNHYQAIKNLELARAKLRNMQKLRTNSHNSSNSIEIEIYDEYISGLNLDNIRKHVGQVINIQGIIKGVYIDKKNQIIHFDFAANPLKGFYAFVPTRSFYKFPNPTNYLERNVTIYGCISLDINNQPCTVLNETRQLRNIN